MDWLLLFRICFGYFLIMSIVCIGKGKLDLWLMSAVGAGLLPLAMRAVGIVLDGIFGCVFFEGLFLWGSLVTIAITGVLTIFGRLLSTD